MTIKIFGSKITISFLFTALIALLLLFDKSGIFVLALIAIIIHETGHLLAMKLLKQTPLEIRMMPAGVIITKNKILTSFKDEFIIASGGIILNLYFTIIFVIFYKCQISERFFLSLAIINIIIAIFNMLPIYGLDGYDMLRILLCRKNEKAHIMIIISSVTICLILILGIILFYKYYNPTLMITALYLIILTILNLKR